MQRPKLGQKIKASDRLVRAYEPNTAHYTFSKVWKRFGERYNWADAHPVKGMYIGYRTYSDGLVSGEYREYTAEKSFEVWLVVEGPRQNPVPVLPIDAEWRFKI